MFWSSNKKNRHTPRPAYPSFAYINVGYEGVYITRTCFPDGSDLIDDYNLQFAHLGTMP